jgi:hypothetical protein
MLDKKTQDQVKQVLYKYSELAMRFWGMLSLITVASGYIQKNAVGLNFSCYLFKTSMTLLELAVFPRLSLTVKVTVNCCGSKELL